MFLHRVHAVDLRTSVPNVAGSMRLGFTLVESIIVMLVLAILAAAAAPRFSQALQSYRVKAAAKRVLLDLERAQTHARTTGRDVSIDFDKVNDRYTVVGISSLDHPSADYTVDLTASPYYCEIFALASTEVVSQGEGSNGGPNGHSGQGGQIMSDNLEFVFDRFERVNSGGIVRLKCGEQMQTIVIDANSGESRLQ